MDNIFSDYIIMSDLDGTFLGEGGRTVEENVKAVEYFKEHGGYFTFSTGRTKGALLKMFPRAAELSNAPAILANGSYIGDLSTGEKYFETCLDEEGTLELLKETAESFPNVGMRLSRGEYFICPRVNDRLEREFKIYGDLAKRVDFDNIESGHWNKVVFVGNDSVSIDRLKEFLEAKNDGRYALSRSGDYLFEILDKNATKGTMLVNLKKLLAERFGRDMVTVGVGDYNNDYEMLKAADISACPENAIEEIREICTVHLCHHDKGAIADLVKRLENEALKKNAAK